MDSKLFNAWKHYEEGEEDAFLEGFRFAAEVLRTNRFYGHYAEGCANWLEKHLTEEVDRPTSTSLSGKDNGPLRNSG